MTRDGAGPAIPPIAPAATPHARLATALVTQLSPVRAMLPNGRELLATCGLARAERPGGADEPAPGGAAAGGLADSGVNAPPRVKPTPAGGVADDVGATVVGAVPGGTDLPAGVVTIWDVRHRRVLRTIATVPAEALALYALPDGRCLVATLGIDGMIRVWDALSGRRHWKRHGSPRGGLAMGELPDGRAVVVAGADYAVRVRDAFTGDRLSDLDTPSQRIPAVACTRLADGRTLVAAATGARVTVWDVTGRAVLAALTGHRLPVAALALHPDADGGAVLAAATGQKVRVWSIPDGDLRHTFTCRAEPPLAGVGRPGLDLTGTADGRVLVAYGAVGAPDIWLWDAMSGHQQAGVPAGRGPTWGVTFMSAPPDVPGAAAMLGVSTGHTVRLWPLLTAPDTAGASVGAALAAQPASVDEAPGRVSALAFVPGQNARPLLASAHAGGSLYLREPAGGRVAHELGTGGDVETLAALHLAAGPVLAGASSRTVRAWDPATGRAVAEYRWTPPPRLAGLAVSTDGADDPVLVLVRALDRIAVWDVRRDRLVRELSGRARIPRSLAAARRADGRALVASGSYDGAVQLWDFDAGTVTRTLVPHLAPVKAVALAVRPDDGVVVLSGDDAGTLRVWDADSGALLGVRQGLGGPVAALACRVQSDGGLLVAAALDAAQPVVLRWSTHPVVPAQRVTDGARDAAAT